MPTLADLFRMGRQYVADALPGGSLNPEVTRQGALDAAAISATPVPVLGDLIGLGADVHRYVNEPESRTPGNFALTGLGLLPFVPAMTAWHSSPHKFNKFSLDKIGTGEGAQAYGHGLYLAESPAVSGVDGQYFNAFKNTPEAIASGGPFAYKTDIPDEAVARFLDWDKPLSQQAPEVQDILYAKGMDKIKPGVRLTISGDAFSPIGEPTGADIYNRLSEIYSSVGGNGSVKTTDAFSKLGIPGIRYLNGGSRGAGTGTSNFVVFDPEMIRILERNGQPTGLQPWKPGEYKLRDLITN